MMNDELEPVEEIRGIRETITRKYKTTDAYFEHLETIPPTEILLARVRRANEKAGAARLQKDKPAANPARRGRSTKHPVHA